MLYRINKKNQSKILWTIRIRIYFGDSDVVNKLEGTNPRTHLFVKKWSNFCLKNKKCWCRRHFISFKIKTKSWPQKWMYIVLVFLPLAYEFFAYLWWKICFGVGIQEYWVCLHLPLVLGWGQYKVWWPQRPFGGWKTLLQHLFSPKPLMIILLTNSSDVFTNFFHYFFPQIFLSLSSWKTNHNEYLLLKIRRFGIRDWWNYLMNHTYD